MSNCWHSSDVLIFILEITSNWNKKYCDILSSSILTRFSSYNIIFSLFFLTHVAKALSEIILNQPLQICPHVLPSRINPQATSFNHVSLHETQLFFSIYQSHRFAHAMFKSQLKKILGRNAQRSWLEFSGKSLKKYIYMNFGPGESRELSPNSCSVARTLSHKQCEQAHCAGPCR